MEAEGGMGGLSPGSLTTSRLLPPASDFSVDTVSHFSYFVA